MIRRLGILGGMFDPIHTGHIDAAVAAEAALGLSGVWVVPAHIPPHRPQPAASSYHRFAMVALAVGGRRGWRASDLELGHDAPSYTADTLARLHATGLAPGELVFILGADAFAEIETWHAYPDVLDEAHFAVISRPGTPAASLRSRLPALAPRMRDAIERGAAPSIVLLDRPTADVSSTAIRRIRAAGGSIDGLVPPAVAQHIEQHALYAVPGPTPGGERPSAPPTAGRLHGQD